MRVKTWGFAATLVVLGGILAGCETTQTAALPPPPPPPLEPTALVISPKDYTIAQTAVISASALPVNTPVPWSNPETGVSGSVKILRDAFHADGRLCKEYHRLTQQGRLSRSELGVICRNSRGEWEVIDNREFPTMRAKDATS